MRTNSLLALAATLAVSWGRVYTSNLVFAEMERAGRCANPVVVRAEPLSLR
jgi:hypothetical protein